MAKCQAGLCSFETAPGSQYCSLHSVGLAEERHDVKYDASLTACINMPAVRTGPVAHLLEASGERSTPGGGRAHQRWIAQRQSATDMPRAMHRTARVHLTGGAAVGWRLREVQEVQMPSMSLAMTGPDAIVPTLTAIPAARKPRAPRPLCAHGGCPKKALGTTELCAAHGGETSKRMCSFNDCGKSAQVRTSAYPSSPPPTPYRHS
jgi:hypothetical protein